MRVETLSDVLEWTGKFHQHLAACLIGSAGRHPDQRSQLLLHYLADHEQLLAKAVEGFKNIGGESVLKTWCYDFLNKHPIVQRDTCELSFEEMDADTIMGEVSGQHDEVVDLYRYLSDHSDIPEVRELTENLLSLEEHQIMLMNQAANRLHDL